MKIILVICVVAAMATVATALRTCVIDTRNCARRRNVCGRFGGSNLCKRFSTMCDLQSANCQQTAQYTVVGARQCSGIAVNARRSCGNGNGNGVLGSGNGVIYGNGNGGLGSGYGGLSNGNVGLGSGGLSNGNVGLGSGGLSNGNVGLGSGSISNGGLGSSGLGNGGTSGLFSNLLGGGQSSNVQPIIIRRRG